MPVNCLLGSFDSPLELYQCWSWCHRHMVHHLISKARNAFSPGMIDRLTCCVEPKRSLEAGALCVEVLVLLGLTVIRGTEVVLVPRTFECSLHGVHTLQCLKIEMGPSLVLQTYRCLGVCWVMPSRVFVFVYLSEILELACSLACVNFV